MRRMNRPIAVFALLAIACVIGSVPVRSQQNRSVQGTVLDAKDNAIPQAIVYLKNNRSRAVRTYIAGDDGKFVFHALAPNTDYNLYAEYQGKRSSSRTVSAFDSRADITMDLKISVVR